MSYITINLNDVAHKRAYDYFFLTGHPEFYFKGQDIDFDIEYREYLVEKLSLDYDDVVESSNGSTHTVIDNDPISFKLKLDFFTDYEKNDFAIEVTGELKYNTSNNTCVFFPNNKTVKQI
tara:strand:+ start:1877 stop:2236 length:360 start_codon:yes stop_codon:yes gene_type:complete